MTCQHAYILGMGLVTPLGYSVKETKEALEKGKTGLSPISLFSVAKDDPLPVGQIENIIDRGSGSRTHDLALSAAKEAMAGSSQVPDAVVIGVTTGGMLETETFLKENNKNPESYIHHSVGLVGECIAREFQSKGPVITVSTACSSGAVAIKLSLEMLKTGMVKTVLTGGVDSLCRLTYYGFNSLQLIDEHGAKPLDAKRRGMSVAEGAAILFLSAHRKPPKDAIAEVLGAGLSCDAYHPTAPHPDGLGAQRAMEYAVKDANISFLDIDYIQLHGTGTLDNDNTEARAINRLFLGKKPPLASLKGAMGHGLAAAGATGAIVSALCVKDDMVFANIGCTEVDPKLNLNPVKKTCKRPIRTVLSNALGFGGNNASLVIGKPDLSPNLKHIKRKRSSSMAVIGSACISGAGDIDATMENIHNGKDCQGVCPIIKVSENLPSKRVRRLKRLPRLALSLAIAAHGDTGLFEKPSSIFFGTAWGPLSETHDFLSDLFDSNECFASPSDFIGSVHTAPAGQAAIQFNATGPNITTTGGDYSFEQSLMTASLMGESIKGSMLVAGADEFHKELSTLFDPSVRLSGHVSDGGGALCLTRDNVTGCVKISLPFFERTGNNSNVIQSLINSLGGVEAICSKYGAILTGIPLAEIDRGQKQKRKFITATQFKNPAIDYREITGEFACASAIAAVLAVRWVDEGKIPQALCQKNIHLDNRGILILGFGRFVTCMEVIK